MIGPLTTRDITFLGFNIKFACIREPPLCGVVVVEQVFSLHNNETVDVCVTILASVSEPLHP